MALRSARADATLKLPGSHFPISFQAFTSNIRSWYKPAGCARGLRFCLDMAPAELQLLLQALEERSFSLGADDIAWAFDSAGTKDKINHWVRDYLNPTSLLTTEERALYVFFCLMLMATLINI